jgi:hypothetical protein
LYCIDLRSDVQLKTEEAIQQINEISSKIIDEIDEYENKLIEFNKSNLKPLNEYDKFANELEACYAINSEYLKQHTIDDEMITYLNETAIKLLNKANLEVQNLKDIIFN